MTLSQQPSKRSSRGGWRRALYAVLALMLFVLLLPYLVTPFYRFVQPVSMPMLWRYAANQPVRQTWLPIGEISPVLPRTVIASEDARFCTHRGIDFGELRAAIEDAQNGASPRGASTITMQVVKNVFLWPGRSYVRKAIELPLAMVVDFVWSKRRILEVYLNIAEWGPGIYGIEAAARDSFAKSARSLTPREASRLAVVLPDPVGRDAARLEPRNARVAQIVSGRMQRVNTSCLR